jgi:hypothetical protein
MESTKVKWFNKWYLLLVWIIVFYPIGIFGLIKNEKAPRILKIIITSIYSFFSLLVAIALISNATPKSFSIYCDELFTGNNVVVLRAFYADKNAILKINNKVIPIENELEFDIAWDVSIGENLINVDYKAGDKKYTNKFVVNRLNKTEYEVYQKAKKEGKEYRNREQRADDEKKAAYIKKYGEKPINPEGRVKEYLETIAKDPTSVKILNISDVYINDQSGYLVQAKWMAKNSFGANLSSVNWFIISNNRVIDMKDFDAFK